MTTDVTAAGARTRVDAAELVAALAEATGARPGHRVSARAQAGLRRVGRPALRGCARLSAGARPAQLVRKAGEPAAASSAHFWR